MFSGLICSFFSQYGRSLFIKSWKKSKELEILQFKKNLCVLIFFTVLQNLKHCLKVVLDAFSIFFDEYYFFLNLIYSGIFFAKEAESFKIFLNSKCTSAYSHVFRFGKRRLMPDFEFLF